MVVLAWVTVTAIVPLSLISFSLSTKLLISVPQLRNGSITDEFVVGRENNYFTLFSSHEANISSVVLSMEKLLVPIVQLCHQFLFFYY